jgi:hypothetical protein
LDQVRLLIPPYSVALSDGQARQIERFLDRGGMVIAEGQTGRMDRRCHWRKPALFAGERKGLLRQAPGRVPVEPAFPAPGRVPDHGAATRIQSRARRPRRQRREWLPRCRYPAPP